MSDLLVLLGTAGGAETAVRPTSPPTAAYGISSALVVGGRIYIVDVGQGSARQLALADPLGRGPNRVMRDLAAFFITHLHSDHTMDLANFVLSGFYEGWPDRSVPVIGPGPRTITAQDYPRAGLDPDARIRAPGTADLVGHLLSAYEADSLDRELSGGKSSLRTRLHGIDIPAPEERDRRASDPGLGDRWQIYSDERLQVSATLVEHGTMYPAFAYRFDTANRSIVFSGDTGPSDNLVSLAEGADVLVHEAIDPQFGLRVFGEPPYTQRQRRVAAHVLAKHTAATEVGLIAQRAGVGKLVLSGFAPGNLPVSYWKSLLTGFDGETVIGDDLTVIAL